MMRFELKFAVGTAVIAVALFFVVKAVRGHHHAKLNVISDQRRSDGVRQLVLTHKTAAELEKEKRVAAAVLAQAVSDVAVTQKVAVQKVRNDLKKQYSESEVQTELTAIVARKDFSLTDKLDECVDFRNQVSVSATQPAKKAQLIKMINQRLAILSNAGRQASPRTR